MGYTDSELVSPRQLAKESGWPERRIRNLIALNQIKHIRIGSSIFMPKDAVAAFVSSNMVRPDADQAEGNCNG